MTRLPQELVTQIIADPTDYLSAAKVRDLLNGKKTGEGRILDVVSRRHLVDALISAAFERGPNNAIMFALAAAGDPVSVPVFWKAIVTYCLDEEWETVILNSMEGLKLIEIMYSGTVERAQFEFVLLNGATNRLREKAQEDIAELWPFDDAS